jgi:hypothetical protein
MKLPTRTKVQRISRSIGFLAVVVLTGLSQSPHARADSMLLATTDMVAGSAADTFSFNAPSSGTVTAQLTSVPWPVPLSSLSFSATDASNVLASWSGTPSASSAPYVDTFQVGSGTYYAHVNAAATGSLDLGLYSLLLTFKPSAVPLPASDWTLLGGVFVLFGLVRAISLFAPFSAFKLLRGAGSVRLNGDTAALSS